MLCLHILVFLLLLFLNLNTIQYDSMDTKVFKCSKHPHYDVSFFCTVNQWHFVPLCNQCIPPHTQNHPKNFKVTIESYDKVRQKSQAQSDQATVEYKKRLQKINQYLSSQRLPSSIQALQAYQAQVLGLVNSYFASIRKQLQQKYEETGKFQTQLLQKLQQSVKADIKDLENTDDIQEVDQWGEVVRRLYFKDGITPYLDEIDDVLKDHQQRLYEKKDLPQPNVKKLQEDIKKLLTASIYVVKQNKVQTNEEKVKNPPAKDQKKGPKIVIKPKICKNCNGELEYLTQLKKHLFCPTCGGKQRNYTAKKL